MESGMNPTKESTLVSHIAQAVWKRYPDAFIWKVHGGPMQEAGMPDLALCVNGYYVGIEVKLQRPGESYEHAWSRVTASQRTQLRRIYQAGGIAGVALSVEEALDIIEKGMTGGARNH